MTPSPRRILAVAVAALVALAACGDDDASNEISGADAPRTTETTDAESTDTSEADDAFPVTVASAGTEVTIETEPEAIVSLSPSATEMLFAIGAGDQVAAADDNSNFPADAPTTDLSGFDPNLEAVIAHDPDLVVVEGDANDVIAGLGAADVPVLLLPASVTLDDTYSQIEILGAATGHVADAAAVVAEMQSEIEELVASLPERAEPLTYYHELDDTLFSVTSRTFIGEIYSLAGLANIADAADPDGAAGGYPQLSAEYLVDADPDLIFLADTKCCGQDLSTVAARPGFDGLTAVTDGHVVGLDDDIASRWGPRVVDLLRAIVEATATVDAAAG